MKTARLLCNLCTSSLPAPILLNSTRIALNVARENGAVMKGSFFMLVHPVRVPHYLMTSLSHVTGLTSCCTCAGRLTDPSECESTHIRLHMISAELLHTRCKVRFLLWHRWKRNDMSHVNGHWSNFQDPVLLTISLSRSISFSLTFCSFTEPIEVAWSLFGLKEISWFSLAFIFILYLSKYRSS